MHLLTIFIFAYSVKINAYFWFFYKLADDREITQKKQRPGPNPDDIKIAVFFVETKKYKLSKDYFVLQW